jgi:hypothetical protein
MTRTIVRSLCLLVLAASIAVRFQANRNLQIAMTEFDPTAAITEVLLAGGYRVLENPIKPPKMLASVVYFQRTECNRASLIMPYIINAESLPLLSLVAGPEFHLRFFYLDKSWSEQNRVSMYFQWLKYSILDIFGASRYFPVKQAIVVAEPPDCKAPAGIDWRMVWDKHLGDIRDSGTLDHVPPDKGA